MENPIVEKKYFQSAEEKEKFFTKLENNPELLKEALEVILQLVISVPGLTSQLADLIETDYRNLYLAMLNKFEKHQQDDLPECCHKL